VEREIWVLRFFSLAKEMDFKTSQMPEVERMRDKPQKCVGEIAKVFWVREFVYLTFLGLPQVGI
jgi:hypothetical protein